MGSFSPSYPGVYIEELSSGQHTITGVATSIAAFIGWAPQGPVNEAVMVESFPAYQAIFGSFVPGVYLAYAVNQFFQNGGQQAYIVRLVWDGTQPPANGIPAAAATAQATGVGYATAEIIATIGSISGSAQVSVGTKVLQSIAVTPANLPPLPIGASIQLAATGAYSDGSSGALTVNWTSNNPAVLSVTSSGVATAASAGTATVTATYNSSSLDIVGSVTVTVTAASLASITVAPSAPSLAVGQSQQLTATGNYTDGTTQNLTAIAAWASDAASDATVGSMGVLTSTGAPTIPGQVNAVASGAAHITAKWLGQTSSAIAVTVNPKVLTSITITPASTTLQNGQTVTFSAIPLYSDGMSTPALTAPVWAASNSSVATNVGSLFTAANIGSTTITVTSGSISASATLTVTAATLNSVSVTPSNFSIASGQQQQLTALGIYSDGTTADVTESATWSGAGVAFSATQPGLVTGETVSVTSITATWQGKNGTANATVTVAVPTSIAVTPESLSLELGQTQQFAATGTYSDGSTPSVTNLATWTSSAPANVTVNSTGLATAVAAGGSLTLFATSPGAWGNSIQVSIAMQPPPNSNRFSLLVQQMNSKGQLQTLQSFANLSVNPTDPQYVATVIDNDCNYVTFINPSTNAPVAPTAAPRQPQRRLR
jgi:uncharacterized protein YjdB